MTQRTLGPSARHWDHINGVKEMPQIQQLIEAFMDLDAAFASMHQALTEPLVGFHPQEEAPLIEEFPIVDGITYL